MTPEPSKLQAERVRFLFLWIIPIALVAGVSLARAALNDPDTFWHIAAGRWMIEHRAVPRTDPFSFTFAGRPWVTHEWLSEVALAAAFDLAGWSGVLLLTGLALGALAALTASALLRWLPPLSTAVTLAFGLSCLGPSLLARPHILALPVLAFWTLSLLKAREESRAPNLWLAAIMLAWANLHASFIVGCVIAAALALEAMLDGRGWRRQAIVGWAAFLALSFAATLVTPNGLAGIAFPFTTLNMKVLPGVTEWRAPDFMASPFKSPLEVALLAGLFFAFYRGVRLSAVRAALLLAVVHMTLQHARNAVILGVVAPLILAEPFGRTMGRSFARPVLWRLPWPQTTIGVALLALIVTLRVSVPEVRTDGVMAPISALANTPAALRTRPVLNDYDFGGYLIFEGVKPFIDGRADMYGDAFTLNAFAIENGDAARFADAVRRYNIAWTIEPPSRAIVALLDRTPGWKRIYADRYAVVHERIAPTTPSAPATTEARPSSVRG
jgi:hypothetical protein